MAKEPNETKPTAAAETPVVRAERRRIPGNFPYTGSPGVLQRVLERIPISEKPATFTTDFLSTVMQASGGAARPVIPILKSTGLLSQSAVPTELYSQFQTEGQRAAAALEALKIGYQEIFKRNTYAHKASEKDLIDIIVQVTGLARGESIVRYILNTFQVFQTYASKATDEPVGASSEKKQVEQPTAGPSLGGTIGLIHNINIVLPETTNIEVYNAIFKSLRGNLL